jgi:small ligand-binding sensory domain FIST
MSGVQREVSTWFRCAHACADDWRTALHEVVQQLGEVPLAATLGFVYFSDKHAAHAAELLAALSEATGLDNWIGSVGIGVLANEREYFDEPAVAVMLGEFEPGEFAVFSGKARPPDLQMRTPSGAQAAHFAVVHGDPETADMPELIEDMAGKLASGFLVGGISSSREQALQIANGVLQGGLSGAVFSSRLAVLTRHTQGARPLGTNHHLTAADRNIIFTLDDRPALDVLKEDLGPRLALGLRDALHNIHVGLPIQASDTGDYLVRNLVGIDPDNGLLAVAAPVTVGMPLMFCERDAESARVDLLQMLDRIAAESKVPPRGGLYFSCLGRGQQLFGRRSAELELIRERLGNFPLVGFACNGEISHDRLYGYTGVLTLFL